MVEQCLINTISSVRGRWLLDDHQEAASELALNGMHDGQLVRATVDRTFICNEGLRWVVDYKTGGPASGESADCFMAREAARYAGQLQLYAALVGQFKPGGPPLRRALYFPLFDGWFEVDS